MRWIAANTIAGTAAGIIGLGLTLVVDIGGGVPPWSSWFGFLVDWAVYASIGAVFGFAQQRALQAHGPAAPWALRTTIGALAGGLVAMTLVPRILTANLNGIRTALVFAIIAGTMLGIIQSIGFRHSRRVAIWTPTTMVAMAAAAASYQTLYLNVGHRARILGDAVQLAVLSITLSTLAGLVYGAMTATATHVVHPALKVGKT